MAFYADEDEVWKCRKHPSKRRRSGICPFCLKDRLASLCLDCAHPRPCACSTSSSCSSSSSSLSHFAPSTTRDFSCMATVGHIGNLIDSEPAFRRSRSLAIPFLRTKPKNFDEKSDSPGKNKTATLWSMFGAGNKSKKCDGEAESGRISEGDRRRRMRRSKSVAATVTSESGNAEVRSSPLRWKSWHFPSPIKVFRQSRASKIFLSERSPLHRG